MEKECPSCYATVDVEGTEEGSRVTCPSCSLDMRILHGELVDECEAKLQRMY